MERKLVTVAKVLAKHPIEGADLIERIQVKGWNLVSGKGNFEVGDLCAYFEVDSFLPQEPEFEFLRKGYFTRMADGSEGFRLKTIKLRGQISQGLAIPLPEVTRFFPEGWWPFEGAEITEYIGVRKYEPPIPAELAGMAKGMFPVFVPKTDEERVQNLQELIDEHNGDDAYISLKIDGASMTVYRRDDDFGVCTRGVDLLPNPNNSLWKIAIDLKLEEKLREVKGNYAIQGEIYGEGIQGNKLKLKGQHFAAFNIFNIDESRYLDYQSFIDFCHRFGIPTVPILDSKAKIHNSIDQWVEQARVKYPNGSHAEGIVIRTKIEKSWRGNRISFKSINPDFLLKHGE